ncbi:basic secretory protein-like protein [Parvularcula lutaonensis]|uniref:Basic secretory protein-like protein n=1 Tax=Parvularcula lutaonensis TaxID=491923 RepID=A0ABV7MFY9_9PROT|nr:basic secretory protein-like protein [Parvularcula lutaonensis]GGY54506.1 hypothetical protein GCM10007148_25190 [Parvularcula lutaonensis]
MFAIALLLRTPAANASAENQVPGWIEVEVSTHAEVLSGLLKLPRVPFIDLHYEGPGDVEGLRIIDAEAHPERVVIRLSGSWDDPSPDARRQVIRNLAHELAHVWQYTLGQPTENRFFHEGFAEAMALEALQVCGEACAAGAPELADRHRRDCGDALRDEILVASRSRAAFYGCGAVLTRMTAENAGKTVGEVYRRFAETGRSRADFISVAGEMAGSDFATSAHSFLHGDHRLAPTRSVLQRLQAGRL